MNTVPPQESQKNKLEKCPRFQNKPLCLRSPVRQSCAQRRLAASGTPDTAHVSVTPSHTALRAARLQRLSNKFLLYCKILSKFIKEKYLVKSPRLKIKAWQLKSNYYTDIMV